MRSLVLSLFCASSIGYAFGGIWAVRAITMSEIEHSVFGMWVLTGWVCLTFAVIFAIVGLGAHAMVAAMGVLWRRPWSRRARVWFLSWFVLAAAIGIPFLGYYYSSGVSPFHHEWAMGPWDLFTLWLLRVGRWILYSLLTAAVAAYVVTDVVFRFFFDEHGLRRRRVWTALPLLVVVTWLTPALVLNRVRGDSREYHRRPPSTVDLARESVTPLAPVCIIGWDGATWDVIDPLLAKGELPNLGRLIEEGSRAPLKSYVPTLSPLLWTTISTGRSPAEHGVRSQVENRFTGMSDWFFFTRRMGFDRVFGPIYERFGVMERVQVTSLARRTKSFWNLCEESNLTCGLVNWRVSWPAEVFDGFNVSSNLPFVYDELRTQDLDDVEFIDALATSIHPLVLSRTTLEECRSDAEETSRRYAEASGLAVDLAPLHEAFALEVGLRFLEGITPAIFGAYFYEIDGIEHRFWKYRDPEYFFSPDAEEVAEKGGYIDGIYRYTDRLLGDVMERMPEDTIYLLVSDHGHFPVFGEFRRSGSHGEAPPGVCVISGPGVGRGRALEDPSVYDVLPTIAYLMGWPVEEDARGRVLLEAFESRVVENRPVRRTGSYGPIESDSTDPERESPVNDALLRKLRDLGYVG